MTDAAVDAPIDGTPMVTLTVVRGGTSTGTITSNAVGSSMVDCGTTCSAQFPPGTLVTLTQTPGIGATFAGWAGVCNDTAPNCSFTLDSDTTVQATFNVSRHTITITPAGNGTGSVTSNIGGIACPGTCSATMDYGTSVTLTATPVTPSIFAGWNDVGCTGTTPCMFTVTQDQIIDAAFALNYSVTVAKNGNGRGTVTSSPTGINCGTDCDQVYSAGTMVMLTAAADADSDFTGWDGACTGTGACSVTVDAVVAVTANFALKRYTLTATRSGSGAGVVTSNPIGINCGTDCDEPYDHGTQVTLNATADGSSTFTGWSAPECPGTGGCVVTMTGARSVGGTFTLNRYPLTVAKSGTGAALGTVTSTPTGISCGTDCDELYDANSMVTLTAATATGATFTGWSGAGCMGTGTCVVTMSGAQSVTAAFALNQYTLSVGRTGNGAALGAVTSNPIGIACGSTCSASYAFGTMVTLTPAAMTGAAFTGWTGGGCSGLGSCVVTVGGDTAVSAEFTLDTYTLTLNKSGAGVGTVTSDLAGINCGASCNTQNATYNHGQTVVLSHAAGTDSEFVAWSGACSGSPCSVDMTQNRTVTATFKRTDKTLTVNVGGSGTVTSMDGGINAPTDPSHTYAHGTMVTLTAAWNATSHDFTWGGACSGSLATCSVTMDQAHTVSATFTLKTYTLTVNKAGAGTGTVTSSAGGINCGPSCPTQTVTLTHGQTVNLSQSASVDAGFVQWGGDCSGIGACSVSMTGTRTVTAEFRQRHLVEINVLGNGAGTVTVQPGDFTCSSSTCTRYYDAGTDLSITASPATSTDWFTGFSGACSGTSACSIEALDTMRSIDATFVPSYTVGGTVSGLWTGANLVLGLQPTGWASQQVQVTQEGAFTFSGRVPANTDFSLSVVTQPGMHSCTVQTPSGTVSSSNIANLSLTCTSTIGVSIALLGPDPFTFDPQVTTQALPVSAIESEIRVLLDGPAGSSAQLNGSPLAYLVASSPVSLVFGSNTLSITYFVGGLSRTYQIVLNRSGATVVQSSYIKPFVRDPNDRFGFASAGYANRIIVGAPFEDSNSTASASNNSSADSGAAYMFRRDGQVWSQEWYFKASDVTPGQLFGRAVDIDDDVAVVGGPSVGAGAAYVFRRVGTTWTQEARLAASDAANGMNFGNAVAVHGSVIAIAAQYESESPTSFNGAVYVYRHTAGQWNQEQVLRAPNRETNDYFGWSVDLDASRIVVGALGEDSAAVGGSATPSNDNSALESGAAYVFAWTGTTWAFESYLKASNSEAGDEFGTSVSIDDDVIAVTAPAEDSGGSPADNGTGQAGAGYLYRRNGTSWNLEAYVKAPVPRTNANFGFDVAVRDGALIVGENQPSAVPNPGAAYVYRHAAGSWMLNATLAASNAENGDKFGHSVDALAEGGVVCSEAEDGNPGPSDNNANSAGACYAFR